ncbi:thrombospondin type-1 domain-containing protein 1 isoform X2 [Lampris incognitus]|nr:thrombospondin type-1 domain-containing protein 1 isoform X2 [Lampris incognitus]
MEVSYMEFNQIGRNSIDKVRARTRHPLKALRSQRVELPCAFPFTERDFIRVALQSPHTNQEVKSSEPLYLSRIIAYKLLVDNANAFRAGCEGTVKVKLITPPCAHINGRVLLYRDADAGKGAAGSLETGPAVTAALGFGSKEPSSPPVAFQWLTQGENETEFNCSVFFPGKNKYCFRFVFNYSQSPSLAQNCLVVHRSAESWGPWLPWSVCSVSCGEGVRERFRECLLPSGVEGLQCTGMVKEQSLCSLEDCVALPAPSPSLSTVSVGSTPLGGNLVVVAGVSLCLAVILATVLVAVWRKLCRTPQCSSVRRGSVHSPGGRKLSDEASIYGNSLQRPSLSDGLGCPQGGLALGLGQKVMPPLGGQPLSQPLVVPSVQDPERLSPTGQKLLPPIFGYRLAQQQLKEMKKKGLKEATQLYHVSSSPVHDTMLETSASPTHSLTPTPTAFTATKLLPGTVPPGQHQDNHDLSQLCMAAPFPEARASSQCSRNTQDRLSPRVELLLGPPVSGHGSGGSSKRHDRTAEWVEMVERSGLGGLSGGGNSNQKNPNFRRTSSFNDPRPHSPPSALPRQFRERSMTQVGSRTLPEGSCRTKGIRESKPYPSFPSYPIPELAATDWSQCRPHGNDQRWPLGETAGFRQSSELTNRGTNTKANLNGTTERDKQNSSGTGAGLGGGTSGIGGPVSSHVGGHLGLSRAERAEQNWSRRGPSPIQRNILARKLKEAQSSSGVLGQNGRQRSSTFSASTSEQRKARCRSLPMSADFSGVDSSPYRLSEAEQRMMDLDLTSSYVEE